MSNTINANSDLKDIARQVRAEIKQAKKAKEIEAGVKVSVRISRYSMGQSLTVTVTAAPFKVVNPEHAEYRIANPHDWFAAGNGRSCPHLRTTRAQKTLDVLDGIVGQYYVNNSDHQVDYYRVNFSFTGADFSHDLENVRGEMKRIEAERKIDVSDLTLDFAA